MKHLSHVLVALALVAAMDATAPAQEVKPLKALLITGGCCHDYTKQKMIIAEAVSKRAQVEWTLVHQGGTATNSKIPFYENADWAKGFDIVVHNECFSDIPDPAWTQRVLKPHQDGLPGVVIHCAMHCYRDKTNEWFKFCGVTSHRHGGHFPFEVTNLAKDNPIMKGFGEKWKTPKGELYHIEKLGETATPLAQGYSPETKSDHVCVWTNLYGDKKTRVFGTTVGHYNEEMSDPVFGEYLTRGILWATGKLEDEKYLTPMKELKVTEIGAEGKQSQNTKPLLQPGQKVQAPENLAAQKKTTSDGDQDEPRSSDKAVDGKLDTRWSPVNGNPGHWWQVDLGKPEELTGARIVWEFDGRTYRYIVEGSADGKTWSLLSDQQKREDADQEHVLKFAAKGIQHVRIKVTGLDPGAWGSIFEVEVHGTKMVEKVVSADSLGMKLVGVKGEPALKGVKVPVGFKATLFAGPPHVSYPTVVSATPSGVLYVGVDENGSLGQDRQRAQKIVRCEDTDGDGKADKFSDFVPRVESPRGLVADGKTLYVLHPPFVRAYHDDNADGVADRDEVLVEGLGFDLKFRGADHTTNGMRLGIDGWLYIAVGDYGFVAAKGKDGGTLQLHGGGIVRVRTDGTELELVARGLRNVYDVAVDSRLNLFTRDNTNDGGGWNVRLSHIIGGGAEYGYPTLFKNFSDEIVQPLADYGGGSPTGALAVDEPGLPPEIGQTVLTCDWGRNVVYRHPLTPKGAGFTAEQHEFVQVPRPTDIDVDGLGRFYISSWTDGGFAFSKPDVGYVICVMPERDQLAQPTVLDFAKATDEQLLGELISASHTRRLAAQREMLRRGPKEVYLESFGEMLGAQHPLPVYVAIINTWKQMYGAAANEDLAVTRIFGRLEYREFVLRALADRRTQLKNVVAELFRQGLADPDPRVRLQATISLGRLNQPAPAFALTTEAGSSDALIAHAAVKSLVALNGVEAALQALDREKPEVQAGALLALQAMHDESVVAGLIGRLPKTTDPALKQGIFRALCRLYYREAEWKGEWWGTRPDTSGPYFKPVTWEQSEKIKQALASTLASAEAPTVQRLLPELVRHKIEIDQATERLVALTKSDSAFRPRGLELILAQSKLVPAAAPVLAEAALAGDLPVELRARVASGLLKPSDKDAGWHAAEGVFAAWGAQEQLPPLLESTRDEYLKQPQHRQHVQRWIELSQSSDPARRSLAQAVLLEIDTSDNKAAGAAARKHLEALWKTPAAANLLQAIGQYRLDAFAYQVSLRLASEDPAIKSAAAFAAKRLQLDDPSAVDPNRLIAKLPYEQTLADAEKEKGDPNRGKLLFRRQGCVACHTTSKDESLKGPYLGDISNRYKRPELIESIVKPSAKIAQGFVTHGFLTAGGETIDGFIVRESGDEVEIRTQTGASVILQTDEIEQRKKRDVSLMPQGLVDKLTPSDLASIVAYLESLKGK